MWTNFLPGKRPLAVMTSGLLLGLTLVLTPRAFADTAKNVGIPTPPAVFAKKLPESIADLKTIQEHVRKIVDRVSPCTVGLMVGKGQGSGIIVSEDGFILTAGHVSGKPGQEVVVILPDGKKLKGKSLGRNGFGIGAMDSGMIKITDPGKYPYVEMGKSGDQKSGNWCVAIGHPGGWKQGRTPVVRVGRILSVGKALLQTDCTLVGGDSGGPLFDMQGRVIGINSRIGPSITYNIHVPVDTYRDTWDRLVQGDEWGANLGGEKGLAAALPYLGVQGDTEGNKCKITAVTADSPADKAGLKADDFILRFGKTAIEDYDGLAAIIRKCRPGERVEVSVQRGTETLTLTITIGKRPE